LNENILIYGGRKLIYIVSINEYELINIIMVDENDITLYKLSENIILSGVKEIKINID